MEELSISEAVECMARARPGSPALREVLLPEVVWKRVFDGPTRTDGSNHASVSLLALARGYLGNVTRPIERFLLECGVVSSRACKQYVTDLRETWLVADDPLERRRLVEIFYGRLSELQLAHWLERQGWRVTNMECWGASHDIIAEKDGCPHVIETKHIGQELAEFKAVLAAGRGQNGGFWRGMYDSVDYLQLRALDLAEQLEEAEGRRVAALVLSHAATGVYRRLLGTEFLDFSSPKLHRKEQTQGMVDLLADYDERGDLDDRMASWPSLVDDVWIIGVTEKFEFDWLLTWQPVAPG